MSSQQVTHLVVSAFADELSRAGVQHVCVCPGSRSTPLAMILAAHPSIKVWMHLDERSASFFALGMAKQSREPVAVLCTSGTAAANFLPAVVEAWYAHVPLIVLTADRPPELRDVGAPQTIDQIRLYGRHVKWFVDLPVPEFHPDALRYVRSVAVRAATSVIADPPGPVHVNLPFREPLVPMPPSADDAGFREVLADGRPTPTGRPYVWVQESRGAVDADIVDGLADDLLPVERGLIVCGPQGDPSLADAVARLSSALGYPILADPLSQVRSGEHDRGNIIDRYDAFLRDEPLVTALAPDVVLRFGAMPTSKPLTLYLQRYDRCRQILVGNAGWNDPSLRATDLIRADGALFCGALVDAIGRRSECARDPKRCGSWLSAWLKANVVTDRAIQECLEAIDETFEGRVFSELAELVPDGATLFAGNSMPVRDLDTFFPSLPRRIRFQANRGANGIDGVVSSALGAAAVADSPLTLVIGDISFYHDLNGLLAAKTHGLSVTVILLNNDGGGIFSFLPQSAEPEYFEQLFGTPHGLDFAPVVGMYGGTFQQVSSWHDFRSAVHAAQAINGLSVIELRTTRDRNVTLHRKVWRSVSEALAREFGQGLPG